MSRIIGIRHRVKATAEGEARPTQVVVLRSGGHLDIYELLDEQAELDFLREQFPTSFRSVSGDEDLSGFPNHHFKLKTLKKGDAEPASNLLRIIDGKRFVIQKVADTFDGLQKDDVVAMSLGGSGDYFAFALSRRGEEIGVRVIRMPTHALKRERGEDDKSDDALLLAKLASEKPDLFHDMRPRDLAIIHLREAQYARIEAMKARIGCEQRLRQRFIGKIFCNSDGYFPEGNVEKLYDEAKANDVVLSALLKEEAACELRLKKSVEASEVWKRVFNDVEGMGPAIAARIIAGVDDIRRFPCKEQFKAFAGVHVLPDGRFARKRSGTVSNWHPDLRQAFFLFGDQMNRRPDSVWGRKLREYKVKLRAKHPEPVKTDKGVMRYADGHIHKMATWRTITKFAEWLFKEWKKLEGVAAAQEVNLRKAA